MGGESQISKLSGLIVRGHGRFLAAQKAGFKKIPVDFQEYDSYEDEISDLIADNKIVEFSKFDNKLLEGLMSDLKSKDFDLNLTGFVFDDDKNESVVDEILNEEEFEEAEYQESLDEIELALQIILRRLIEKTTKRLSIACGE